MSQSISPEAPQGNPRPPSGGSGVRRRRDPEAERYDELKGKDVVLVLAVLLGGQTIVVTGTLRWVDRYTVGLWMGQQGIGGADDQVWIVNKSNIVMLGAR